MGPHVSENNHDVAGVVYFADQIGAGRHHVCPRSAKKVLGSFGGPGLNAMMNQAAAPFSFMRPAGLWWAIAALSEFLGGIIIVLGLFTRVGAFLILCTMITAVFGVHWPLFFAPKGIEYPMALGAMSIALLISGGGMASVDLALTGRRR